MQLYPKLIMDALATVTYAGTKKNLVDSQMVADQPAINGNKVTVVLEFPRDTDPFLKSTVKAAEAAIKYHCGQDVEVEIQTEFKSKPRPEVGKLLPQVKNVIAVSSGKGGVGKSSCQLWQRWRGQEHCFCQSGHRPCSLGLQGWSA